MQQQAIRLTIDDNGLELIRAFQDYAAHQLPFAAAVALTRTAEETRDKVRAGMSMYFHLRRNSPRGATPVAGVRHRSANKKDWPRPHAAVGTIDDFMVDHIMARWRPGKEHSRTIPTKAVPSKTRRGKFRKAFQAKTLLEGSKQTTAKQRIRREGPGRVRVLRASKKGLLIRARDGHLMILKKGTTAQRRSERRALRKGKPLARPATRAVWRLREGQNIELRWPFDHEVRDGAKNSYQRHFQRELLKAMLTAKKRGRVDSSFKRLMLKSRLQRLG